MRIHTLPLGRTARAMRTVSSGIAGIGWGCIDIDSLLVSLMLSFFISISYVSPILLWQFANNIRVGQYHPPEGETIPFHHSVPNKEVALSVSEKKQPITPMVI